MFLESSVEKVLVPRYLNTWRHKIYIIERKGKKRSRPNLWEKADSDLSFSFSMSMLFLMWDYHRNVDFRRLQHNFRWFFFFFSSFPHNQPPYYYFHRKIVPLISNVWFRIVILLTSRVFGNFRSPWKIQTPSFLYIQPKNVF